MKTYSTRAEYTVVVDTDYEAESEEEAKELAREAFIEDWSAGHLDALGDIKVTAEVEA